MNRIDIKELGRDAAGQYRSEIFIDGKRRAKVYSSYLELLILSALCDQHCEIWRAKKGRPPQRVDLPAKP